ncbi:GNAT family N-acetyltransferase [Peribacillus deserti]|uniref:N-acetyltransferase n=1 Tax=Peribacillus deserti TaxID=673318 RepID=A0A2N5M7W7_9BACI|nr:GNAT family N-acetyltransferase [Peribacillus deserti]PLT30451.1 N-acetyltransferase [Peribacillus deserti]
MTISLKVEELSSVQEHLEGLADLLVQVVEEGASIGFLPPCPNEEAEEYWTTAIKADHIILYIVKSENEVAGSVQLHLSTTQNGSHRAEIAKLLVHPKFRRMGLGRILIQTAEERAKAEGRTLLVLDTREGDPSNLLYTSMGYTEAGRIPNYARSADGNLHTTVYYYKNL